MKDVHAMLTIGLIALEKGCQTEPSEINGNWKLVQLARKGSRSVASELKAGAKKLDAVAVVGCHPAKARFAREALSLGKHVMVDFPAGKTSEETRRLKELARSKDLQLYSPNLLKTEPGVNELKQLVEDPSSKLLSLTINCNFATKGKEAYSMKLAQMLDLVEWIAGAKCAEAWARGSTRTVSAAAHVILTSHENGVKTLLNLRSNSMIGVSTFRADCILENLIVHLNPWAQSVLLERFGGTSVARVNWAVHTLQKALTNFQSLIDGGAKDLRLDDDSDRILGLTRQLLSARYDAPPNQQAA